MFRGRAVASCLPALLLPNLAQAALAIEVQWTWSPNLDASDLISGAGSDLVSTHSSASDVVELDISGSASSSDAWRVEVRRDDATWPAGLTLRVRRTGAGTGPGTISGGTSWVTIGSTDATFFSGEGDRSAIDLQLQLDGASVSQGDGTWQSSVVYTVVDT